MASVCIGFAFGCKDNPDDNNPTDECTVNFELSEHVSYVIDGEEVSEYQMKVKKDTGVQFSVAVEDGFLSDTVEVKADGDKLSPVDGVYMLQVMKDTTINATVLEDLLEVDKEDGYYVVSSLKDLRTVAAMVNSGNPTYMTGKYKLVNEID